jgi:branched-subunit amino acid transport protein
MNIWLVMLAAGLMTFAIRLSFIYLFGRFPTPELVQRSLRFVPPAVLSAILVPELFMHAGRPDVSLSNARLLAGLAAIAVGAWRKNTLLTIVTGMVVLLVLEYLL